MAENVIKNIRIKHRCDTESNWSTNNPVLLKGELAVSSDIGMYKTGDGVSTWSQLSYNNAAASINASNDSSGQSICTTYLKNISSSGQTLTLTKGDNTTSTITTQDTKNTSGSTNSSSKLFLIGAASQAVNPQTYSRSSCYIGTDGCLYSNSTKVSVNGHTHNYLPTTGGTVSGQVTLSKATDISGVVSSEGALIIGSKTGEHLAFDPNEIMAKASATTTAPLYLNSEGGQVCVGNGGLRSNGGELQSTHPNALRAIQGNYGFILRNDGSSTYFLVTNSGNQYGSFNDFRPIAINNSTGKVLINSQYPLRMSSWNGSTLNITYG